MSCSRAGCVALPRSLRVSCCTTDACASCGGRGICAGSMRGAEAPPGAAGGRARGSAGRRGAYPGRPPYGVWPYGTSDREASGRTASGREARPSAAAVRRRGRAVLEALRLPRLGVPAQALRLAGRRMGAWRARRRAAGVGSGAVHRRRAVYRRRASPFGEGLLPSRGNRPSLSAARRSARPRAEGRSGRSASEEVLRRSSSAERAPSSGRASAGWSHQRRPSGGWSADRPPIGGAALCKAPTPMRAICAVGGANPFGADPFGADPAGRA